MHTHCLHHINTCRDCMPTSDGQRIRSNLFMSPGEDFELRALMLQLGAGSNDIRGTRAGHGSCLS